MSELPPYLPEPDAPVLLPASSGFGRRTLVLWVVLIVLFLTIWQFLTPPDGTAQSAPPPSAYGDGSSSLSWIATVIPMLFFGLMIVLFRRAVGTDLQLHLSQEPGLVALAEHRYTDALAVFQKTALRWKDKPACRSVVNLNVGHTQLRAGRTEEALAAYMAVERERSILFTSPARILGTLELAFVYALAGDLDTATRWISEARNRLAKTRDDRMYPAARLCLAEAIVVSRRGNARQAVELLDRQWTKLRFGLSADAMRVADIVRAFADAESGAIREHNVVAQRLLQLEPVVRGEFDYLGARWPEMHRFLATHGLASR